MAEMKVKCDLFQATRNEFYKLNGCRSEWQFWKDYLWKHNCSNFMVEDSDLGENILNGKVRKLWKPYGDDLGIPALDDLFILENDPAVALTSGGNEDEDSLEELESAEDEADVPEGAQRMWRWRWQMLWGPSTPSFLLWSLFFLDLYNLFFVFFVFLYCFECIWGPTFC